MRNILSIYRQDLKSIFTNYAASVVFIALCLLPSLYAWFNIKASWDPYSQEATSQILIGVVNEDKGALLRDNEINIGEQVIEELKQNEVLGWRFVTASEASSALDQGEYYAVITIPTEFSNDILSLISSDVRKGEILYTVNEKINAIAPKITDKGASAVQENVNKTIIETVSKILLETGKDIGFELQENVLPTLTSVHQQLLEVQSKFSTLNETVDNVYEGAVQLDELVLAIQADLPKIQSTISHAKELATSVKTFISSTQSSLSNLLPTIKEDIRLVGEIAKEISIKVQAIMNAIESGSEQAPALVSNLISKVKSGEQLVHSLVTVLESFNKLAPSKPLTPIISQLEEIETELNTLQGSLEQVYSDLVSGGEPNLTILNQVLAISTHIESVTSSLYDRFDTEIATTINGMLAQAFTVADEVLVVLESATDKLPAVENLLNVAFEGAAKGIEGIEYVKTKLPLAEQVIIELSNKIGAVNNSKEVYDLLTLLQASIQERTDFLKTPVELKQVALYPMGNYGSAMTPFYTVLALWVGATFLISMLTVHKHGNYTNREVYFGKLLLFLTIGLFQALIVSIGDLYLLNIYCLNPGLFIGSMLFTSLVFVVIGYSLVSVLGNVGKVISIILLVLQVAGSGGTFPIQLTPKFFQVINPFLPFTYSISLAREAIGGLVQSVVIKDSLILCLYIVLAIVISVILKGPLNKLMSQFTIRLKESGIGE